MSVTSRVRPPSTIPYHALAVEERALKPNRAARRATSSAESAARPCRRKPRGPDSLARARTRDATNAARKRMCASRNRGYEWNLHECLAFTHVSPNETTRAAGRDCHPARDVRLAALHERTVVDYSAKAPAGPARSTMGEKEGNRGNATLLATSLSLRVAATPRTERLTHPPRAATPAHHGSEPQMMRLKTPPTTPPPVN